MSANTVIEASNVAPNESANPSPIHSKEETMGTSSVAVSAAAGSSDSTHPVALPSGKEVKAGKNTIVANPGSPAEPQEQKKARKPPASPWDPADILKTAEKHLARAQGSADPQVKADAELVGSAVRGLIDAKNQHRVAHANGERAQAELHARRAPVERALTPVRALLLDGSEATRQLFFDCRTPDALQTGAALLEEMQDDTFGVGAHLVGKLHAAMEQAGPALRAKLAAEEGIATAESDYRQAKVRLVAALSMLRNSLEAFHAIERRNLRLAVVKEQDRKAPRTGRTKSG